jgi:succinylglutamate desuccinylase
MLKPISGLTIIDSKKPGPIITIMAGIHGDEICGIKAFKKVIPNLKLKKGKVYFILGNLKAIKLKQRQYQTNLNRLYKDDSLIDNKIKKTYEYKRSREIIPYLNDSIALLDIHSAMDKDSTPFAICEKPFIKIAEKLPVKIISSGFTKLEPGGSEGYMYTNKKIGICIECGDHISDLSNQNAIDAIYTFIAHFNMIDKPMQQKVNVDFIYKTKTNFKPIKYFKDFEPIKKGSVIGYDGTKKIVAKNNGFILFVVNRKTSNKEAFLLGKYI